MKKVAILAISAMFMFGTVAQADIDNMDLGGDLLFQYFFGDNFDFNENNNSESDEVDFFRTEFHLWFQADLDDNIMVRISLEGDRALNQTLSIGSPDMGGTDGGGVYPSSQLNVLDPNDTDLEVFIDEAFVKVMDIGGYGVSVTAGRQFLNYGDDPLADNFNQWWGPGFIIADSLSKDPLLITQLGAYEIDPFDAVVLAFEGEQYRVDVLHARDAEDNLAGPGSFNNDDASMWAGYFTYYGLENHQIDIYTTFNDQDSGSGSIGFDGEKWIIGARAAGDITEEIAYKAEVAYQFEDSELDGRDEIEGLGVQAGVNYHPGFDYNPNVGFIYTFLEQDGDDTSMTGFSPPFEGKTYGLLADGLIKTINQRLGASAPIAFTNMHVFNVNGGWEPMENVAWTVDFYYFLLQEELRLGEQDEDDGGFEIDSQIDYRYNDYLTAFVGGGVFFPGDVLEELYGNNDDEAFFFRAGMKVAF